MHSWGRYLQVVGVFLLSIVAGVLLTRPGALALGADDGARGTQRVEAVATRTVVATGSVPEESTGSRPAGSCVSEPPETPVSAGVVATTVWNEVPIISDPRALGSWGMRRVQEGIDGQVRERVRACLAAMLDAGIHHPTERTVLVLHIESHDDLLVVREAKVQQHGAADEETALCMAEAFESQEFEARGAVTPGRRFRLEYPITF